MLFNFYPKRPEDKRIFHTDMIYKQGMIREVECYLSENQEVAELDYDGNLKVEEETKIN